jgi:hypothetical protein
MFQYMITNIIKFHCFFVYKNIILKNLKIQLLKVNLKSKLYL